MELVTALDEHALIVGEFEYDYSDNTLYCGYSSENWKGVTPASVKLRIVPFHTFNLNVDCEYDVNLRTSLEISDFYTFYYNVDITNSAIVNVDSLSFTQMVLKEYNISTEYVGNCSVSLTFEKGE